MATVVVQKYRILSQSITSSPNSQPIDAASVDFRVSTNCSPDTSSGRLDADLGKPSSRMSGIEDGGRGGAEALEKYTTSAKPPSTSAR